MRILPINYIQNNKIEKKITNPYPQIKQATGVDTFTFTGKDLMKLSESEIISRIKDSINYKYFIGQGTEAEVYKIKDSDYCIRIPYEASDLYLADFNKNLTGEDKVNHTVAKMGFGTTIMKFFEGETPKACQNNISARYKFQDKISQLPVKSYNKLLKHIALGIDNEMKYDFSGGNLIVNFETKELIPIDFMKIKEESRPIMPLTQMHSVLTSYGTEINTERKIFEKIIDSALEEFKPNNIPCMDVELFDFESIYKIMLEKFSKDSLEKKINKIHKVISDLKDIKKKEISDKSYAETLDKKIAETRQQMFALY